MAMMALVRGETSASAAFRSMHSVSRSMSQNTGLARTARIGLEIGDVVERGREDFVAGAHARQDESEVKRGVPRAERHDMAVGAEAQVLAELLLELADELPHPQPADLEGA